MSTTQIKPRQWTRHSSIYRERRQNMQYPGDFYAPIGDFLREQYLNYGFTKGTVSEVDFILNLLNLPKGARILDVGCGTGRHSLELARRGYHSFGVDISSGFIEVARERATEEGLNAKFLLADARQLTLPPEFDAAICLCEGAFGLVGSDDGHRQVLAGVHRALKPDAPFVLTAIHALAQARRVREGDIYDPYTCIYVSHETLSNAQGTTREVDLYTTAFTYRELKWLLEEAGFQVEAGFGCTAGRFQRVPLGIDDMEIMMVSRCVLQR
jgi:cyclopropane fatty-acyl-phospholipid synthase-like methyltransferase